MTTEDHETEGPYENFDEVFGSAIDVAVRRAVDRVGREPMGDLELGDGTTVVADAEGAPTAEAAPAVAPEEQARTRRERLEDVVDDQAEPALPKGRLDGVNPYAVLGVSQSASWDQVVAAYRRRARAWHPDGADPAEAARRQELIRQLNVAYSRVRTLRDRRLH
jgi:hypothetical protein